MVIYDEEGNIKVLTDEVIDYPKKDSNEFWNDFYKRLEYEKSFRGRIEKILENILMAFLCCIFSPIMLYISIADWIRRKKEPHPEESKIQENIRKDDFCV